MYQPVNRVMRTVWIDGFEVDLTAVEAALRDAPGVEDGAVIVRTVESAPELTAYVVGALPLAGERIEQHLRARLPAYAVPVALVPVNAIPLGGEGRADAEALARIPVLDATFVHRCEAVAKALPGVEEVGVVVAPTAAEEPSRLHLSDLLPDWTRRGPASTPEVSVAPGRTAVRNSGRAVPAIAHGGPLNREPGSPELLSELLTRAAAEGGERGVRYVLREGGERFQTYRELLGEARRIATSLRQRGLEPGEPVLFQFDRNDDFIPAFWGCVLAGVVPVPLATPPSYTADNSAVRKLVTAFEMFSSPMILAGDRTAPQLRAFGGLAGARVEPIDALRASTPDDLVPALQSSNRALIMLTSGSTGRPKGVTLSHHNLVSCATGAIQLNRFTRDEVMLNWMPLDHVAGLIFFHIVAVFVACQQIHAPIDLVYESPLRWLEWMERFRTTRTFAPNFAYGLVNDRAAELAGRRFDLSTVRLVVNGAEPIVARTARKFLQLLAPHGLAPTVMQPAWGMSETSSGVIFGDRFRLELTSDDDPFVEVGLPIPGFSVRIVNAQGELVSEGEIGRLEVQGETVTGGYFEDPENNRSSFTADGWFKTGDLGVLKDGRLTITGREKDVIIINSVNYYSHEIESAVEEVPGVEPSFTAACAIRDQRGNTDKLAIFFHASGRPTATLLDAIRTQVAKRVGVGTDYLIPVEKEAIPKTEIGKLQRAELVRRFGSGEYDGLLKQVDLLTGNANTLPDWFMRPVWCRHERGAPSAPGARGTTLVFLSGHGLDAGLARVLEREGQRCVLVEPAGSFARVEAGRYRLSLTDAEHHRRLLEQVEAEGPRVERIIHLPGYAPSSMAARSAEAVLRDVQAGVLSLAFLCRALARAGERPLRLLVAASHAQAVGAQDSVMGERAAVAGVVRSIQAELPWVTARHVDLPFGDHEANAGRLVRELGLADAEPEVAYRDGARWVRRLERAPLAPAEREPLPLAPQGVYLLTGGLGGIGQALSRVLIERWQARLVLVGRSPLESEGARTREVLSALEQLGGEVLYQAADVGNPEELEGVFQAVRQRFGVEPSGVFHLAGTFEERPLAEETAESLAAALRAKVLGTWNLTRRLSQPGSGGFLVAFSSVNAFLGGLSVGAYSAANRFLEACVGQLGASGRVRTQTLAWSMWDGVGMASNYGRAALSRARGFHALSLEQGLASLLASLDMGAPQLQIGLDAAHPRMQRLLQGSAHPAQRCTAFVTRREAAAGRLPEVLEVADRFGISGACRVITLEELPRLTSGELDHEALLARATGAVRPRGDAPPSNEVEAVLEGIWKEALGVSRVGVHDDFFALGGHSLAAMRAVSRLNEAFGQELSISALLENPTIAGMARLLTPEGGHGAEPFPAPTAPPALEPGVPFVPQPDARYQPFPLTDIQLAYWLGRGDAYPLGGNGTHLYWEFDSPGWDVDMLERTFRMLVARHDMLRAVFLPGGHQQALERVEDYTLARFDLRGRGAEDVTRHLESMRQEMSHERLASESWPLFRMAITLLDGRMRLHFSIDMLIVDAESIFALLREWAFLYHGGTLAPAPTVTFRDYVLYSEQLEATEARKRSLAHWDERLETLAPPPALPLAREPATVFKPRFLRRQAGLAPEAWTALQTRARGAGLTASTVLLAAFSEVLARASREPRFTLNLTVSNRPSVHPDIAEVLGDFTSTLFLSVDLSESAPFSKHAVRIQQRLFEDLQHRDVSGVRLLRKLASTGRAPSGMPVVFTSMLDISRPKDGQRSPTSALGQLVYGITQTPQLWLDCQVYEEDGALRFNWDYVEGLFPASLIETLFSAFARRLRQLASEAGAWTEVGERSPIVVEAPKVIAAPVPGPAAAPLLHTEFVTQAERSPERPAVIAGDLTLSYGELYRRSLELAHRLRGLGVRPNELVAVVMEKGWEEVVAVLAIELAGAAYLPIDAGAPPARVAQLLQLGEARHVFTQPWVAARTRWPEGVTPLIVGRAGPSGSAPAALPPVQKPGDLAYVIFTSGSTGVPKGVMINHQGARNTIEDINRRFALRPEDRVLALSSLGFDLSVYDIFGTLAAGAALVMPDVASLQNPERLAELVARHRISLWNTVPSYMQLLMDFLEGRSEPRLDSLRLVLLSGDWIPVSLPERIRARAPKARVISLGGATEASIWSIAYEIDRVDPAWRSIPYGKALARQQVYVLDESFASPAIGVPGELYIGGEGVAAGYWRDREKTEASFIIHPRTGERLYRTGDYGARMPDGNIEFLGRRDRQVKIAGYRVDLGEVEAALSAHPGVRLAAAVAYRDDSGNKRLAAYWVAQPKVDITAPEMRAFLKERLPAYMLPSRLEPIEQLPVTSNGKIDRATLEARSVAGARPETAVPPRAPPRPAPAPAPVEDILKDPERRAAFVARGLGVRADLQGRPRIPLASDVEGWAARALRRRSHRRYRTESVHLEQLGHLFGALRGHAREEGMKFMFPSAGSAYPLQTYVYLKEGRVTGMRAGLYYHHPLTHEFVLLTEGVALSRDLYHPVNHDVVEQAAFSVFLVANLEAIRPLYGEALSRDFIHLEVGAVTQLLMSTAVECELGLCPIGTVQFDAVRPHLGLGGHHVLVHSLVGGLPMPDVQVAAAALRTAASSGAEALSRMELETQLSSIWTEVLGRRDIGVHERFFEVGGDSFLLVKLHRRILEVLRRECGITDLLAHPTIHAMALLLSNGEGGAPLVHEPLVHEQGPPAEPASGPALDVAVDAPRGELRRNLRAKLDGRKLR